MFNIFNVLHSSRTHYIFYFFITTLVMACGSSGEDGGSGTGITPNVTGPKVFKTTPPNGSIATPGDQIIIIFNKSMDPTSQVLGGNMAPESDGGTWSTSLKPASGTAVRFKAENDTLTVSPLSKWSPKNDKNLTIDAKDLAGNPLPTVTLILNIVEGIIYVSTPDKEGDDANNGTKVNPKATIPSAIAEAINQNYIPGAVLVSEGKYLVNSGLAIPTHVILEEGISIYGGYSANFNQRDPEIHKTTIQDITTKITNNIQKPNRVIEGGSKITTETVIDGFTIRGTQLGTSDYSSAIFNFDGGSPTIQNNNINGGKVFDTSIGIYNTNGSAPMIQKNFIQNGNIIDGTGTTIGIYNQNSSSPTIKNNTINAGGGGHASNGINNHSSSPTIQNNVIKGGTGTSQTEGILSTGVSFPLIQNNTIQGGTGFQSDGIWNLNNSRNTTIRNNTIFGGSGTHTSGIRNTGVSPTIQNNTINGGTGRTNSYGIYNDGEDFIAITPSSPIIHNNIVFTPTGAGQRYCIYESNFVSNPASVENNNLFDCPTALYRDGNGGGNLNTIQEMETDLTNEGIATRGNVSIGPAFAEINGPDNDISTMGNNDWHLTGDSPTAVTKGGLDLSKVQNNPFSTDKDGHTRTDPWSMGAYEQD